MAAYAAMTRRGRIYGNPTTMDFDLNDEQRLLKDSVDRLMADQYDFEQRKAYAKHAGGYDPKIWAQYAELGLLALPFAEADGGIGGGPVETMIVMEAFGRGLVLEPYVASVVMAGGLIRQGASDAQKSVLLPRVASGELKLSVGTQEAQSRFDLHDVATSAKADGTGWLLNGEKGVVLAGDSADVVLVTARTSGARRDKSGIGLFLVDTKSVGVTRRGYATNDGTRAAQLMLTDVRVGPEDVIGSASDALPLVERVMDQTIAALCAEAVGCMQALHDITLDYLKTRKQFGVPIGSFQVLQHRAADMFIALEQARSMAFFATMMADEPNATERGKAMSAAKVQIGRSGNMIGKEAVQLAGGIGVTMEWKVGHYFKRLTMIDKALGDADYHLTKLAAAGGLLGALA
jgi:pimeloyl-CoA dehydrogenase small subunit